VKKKVRCEGLPGQTPNLETVSCVENKDR